MAFADGVIAGNRQRFQRRFGEVFRQGSDRLEGLVHGAFVGIGGDFREGFPDRRFQLQRIVRAPVGMGQIGQGVVLLHVDADHVQHDAPGPDIAGILFDEPRIVGFAVGDDQQPVSAVTVLFLPGFQQPVCSDFQVLAQGGGAVGERPVDRGGQALIFPRSQRISPGIPQILGAENQQSDVGRFGHGLHDGFQRRLGGGHFVVAAIRHLPFHGTRSVEDDHDVVGVLGARVGRRLLGQEPNRNQG